MPFCGEHVTLAVPSIRGIQIAEIADDVRFDRAFNGSLLEQTKDRQCEERTEQKDQ
jgi:hypothetical protein